MSRIVVGFDGSPAAEAALAFALDEAKLRNLPLRIVCAWEIPPLDAAGSAFAPTFEASDIADQHAEDVLKLAASRVDANPGIRVEAVSIQGHPATVLADQSEDAALLVVGSRGLGAVKSLVLGSVSQAVMHRCACPLLIVPAPD
jgi:nucleotide-binding universal stress UspA family protein